MSKSDGMNFAPKGKPNPVVTSGDFIFAAIGLDHGHIGGMANGLLEAGASLKWIYDPDEEKVKRYCAMYPQAKAARSEEEVLADPTVQLVASAAIPSDRCALGIRAMNAGKDYFADKTAFTTLQQITDAKEAVLRTNKKFFVYFSERLHCEAGNFAGELIAQGAIGRVVQTLGLGPHRFNEKNRPPWFFKREQNGGILCDIGSHQIEQFLYYTGAQDAEIAAAQIGNYKNPRHPGVDDFGDCTLRADNGATGYFRVDWLTPDGLSAWGDGRVFILGTDGFIEMRKAIDLARSKQGANVFLANHKTEEFINVEGIVGTPFFGKLILDCLNRTENAMTQAHIFKASELCVKAQMMAEAAAGVVRGEAGYSN
jgi:predicted dehydrogenase